MSSPPEAVAGSPSLLLIPTPLEQTRFLDQGGLEGEGWQLRICGFGPVAAGARTAQLLAQLQPKRVLLLGIAGSYDLEQHPVGTALEPELVAIDGVGVGEGEGFHGPPTLGFPQWPGTEADDEPSAGKVIHDQLKLELAPPGSGALLTTCAASANPEQARMRRERWPNATAEDMEGFAVALACSLAGAPLRIVRGISNAVGDREASSWRIPAALAAARRLGLELMAQSEWEAHP